MSKQFENHVLMAVHTFAADTPERTARKVCEEAMEFYAEHVRWVEKATCGDEFSESVAMMRLKLEIGDVITAISNYAKMVDINIQECIDLVETKNIRRGYYD